MHRQDVSPRIPDRIAVGQVTLLHVLLLDGCEPHPRLRVVPDPAPQSVTLACARAADIAVTPPDISALIQNLRASSPRMRFTAPTAPTAR